MEYKKIDQIMKEKQFWVIALGTDSCFWDYCKKDGFIVIGWDKIGDISKFKTVEEIKKKYLKLDWGNPRQAGADCPQIWNYVNALNCGDIVLVRKGQKKILGIGEIKSNYYIDHNKLPLSAKKDCGYIKKEFSNIRDVEWFDDFPEDGIEITREAGWIKTIENKDAQMVYKKIYGDKMNKIIDKKISKTPTSPDIYSYFSSRNFYFPGEIITDYFISLMSKPFVILTGISGTGKTKIAQLFAEYMFDQDSKEMQNIDNLIKDFIKYKKKNPDLIQNRLNKQEKFNKIFYIENLKKISESDFEDTMNEYLYYHGRIKLTGSWRKQLLGIDYLNVLKDNLIQFLENESKQPLAPVIEKFLDTLPGEYILFVTAVLHDYSPQKYLPYNEKVKERLKRIGLWNKSIEAKESFAEKYLEINEIAIDFINDKNLTVDDLDHFLWWVEDNDYRVDLKILKETIPKRYVFISVRPDWMDNRGILGFYNPFTEKYESTELVRLLLKAKKEFEENKENSQPYFVVLDEMNLAKVEHYFSDFLSCLESRTPDNPEGEPIILHNNPLDKDGKKILLETEDFLEIPDKIFIPPNVYFSGTVNIDETTYMFSPKVLDRANVIEFNNVNLSDYFNNDYKDNSQFLLKNLVKLTVYQPSTKVVFNNANYLENYKTYLNEINTLLKPHNLHFGYRVVNEIGMFLKNSEEFVVDYPTKLDDAFDYQIRQKILTKFHGSRQKIEKPLQDLFKYLNGESIEHQNLSQCMIFEKNDELCQWRLNFPHPNK